MSIIWWMVTPRELSAMRSVPALVASAMIHDSWAIATYLEACFPDRPTLFGGAAGMALARFAGEWVGTTVHRALFPLIADGILQRVSPADRAYLHDVRFPALGMRPAAGIDPVVLEAFRHGLTPARATFAAQPFLGGERPLYADLALFAAFQWARAMSTVALLAPDDPVAAWRERMTATLTPASADLLHASKGEPG
jgi:glutathione S-transferase